MENKKINSNRDYMTKDSYVTVRSLNRFFENNYLNMRDNSKKTKAILEFLLRLFEMTYDSWIDTYNALDEKKMKSRNTIIKDIKSLLMSPIKKDSSTIEKFFPEKESLLVMYARIMHISNKLAHRYEDLVKSRLNEYSKFKKFNDEKFFEEAFLKKLSDFSIFSADETENEVFEYITCKADYDKYIKSGERDKAKQAKKTASELYKVIEEKANDRNLDENTRNKYKIQFVKLKSVDKVLNKYGLNYDDARLLFIDNGLYVTACARKNAFAMKDDYRIKIHKYVVDKDLKNISYGEYIIDKGNNQYEKLFYVDVPGYEQISVHFQNTDFIDGYPEIPAYQMPFDEKSARREPLLLVKSYSKEFKDFLEKSAESKNIIIDKTIGEDESEGLKSKTKIAYDIMSLSFDIDMNNSVDLQNLKADRHRLAVMAKIPKKLLILMYNSSTEKDFLRNLGLEYNKNVTIYTYKTTGKVADVIVNDLLEDEAKRRLENRVKTIEKPVNYIRKVQQDNAVKKLREARAREREARQAARQAKQELKEIKKSIKISKRQEKSERTVAFSKSMRRKISERWQRIVNKNVNVNLDKNTDDKGEER